MRPNLITRLKEEWNNLDPVDPLRGLIADAIDALAEQPAQQQEPVAWITKNGKGWLRWHKPEDSEKNKDSIPLYTAPTSKPWVGLTDVEWQEIDASLNGKRDLARIFVRAIEAKLKEKNA